MYSFGRGAKLVLPVAFLALVLFAIASVVFPAVFRTCRGMGKRENCLSNLKQIGLALWMYSEDYAGRLPTPLGADVSTSRFCAGMPGGMGSDVTFASCLQPYLEGGTSNEKPGDVVWNPWRCLSDGVSTADTSSYMFRPAVLRASMAGLGLPDFRAPASQIVVVERLAFHSGRAQLGWLEGLGFNALFADGHVQVVHHMGGRVPAVPAEHLTQPGPGMDAALRTPGFPCWFSRGIRSGKVVNGHEWDPRVFDDAAQP